MSQKMDAATSFSLTDKIAFVTGGTSGLGYAIAKAFATAGARVIVASSNKDKVDVAVANLGGSPHTGICVDLTDEASVLSAFSHLEHLLDSKPLDILVNAAGIISRTKAEDESFAAWKRVLDVNLSGAFLSCQHAFKLFKKPADSSLGSAKEPCGVILNIASLASSVALSDVTAYGVSKAGLAQLTK